MAFEELRLDTLKEGRYLETAEADFRRLVRAMLAYADAHPNQAAGSKGKLALEIEVGVTKGNGYAVTATSRLKLPGRPPLVAWPVPGKGDLDGEPALFVPDSVETTNPTPGAEAPAVAEG